MNLFFICAALVLSQCLSAVAPLFIGIAGGTGSGKTTLAQKIFDLFPNESALISEDSYCKDLQHIPLVEREKTNFDHPEAVDFALLYDHLNALKANREIAVPVYNFCTHSRQTETRSVKPVSIIVVEGILLFCIPKVRELFDIKIFLDTDDDVRLLRRIERDMKERGRDFKSIRDQYLTTVKPMHDAFVEPSKRYADVIIPSERHNEAGFRMIVAKLKEELQFSTAYSSQGK